MIGKTGEHGERASGRSRPLTSNEGRIQRRSVRRGLESICLWGRRSTSSLVERNSVEMKEGSAIHPKTIGWSEVSCTFFLFILVI